MVEEYIQESYTRFVESDFNDEESSELDCIELYLAAEKQKPTSSNLLMISHLSQKLALVLGFEAYIQSIQAKCPSLTLFGCLLAHPAV